MPAQPDRRAHPRYELYAQVQVAREREVHIMRARHISRGGLFIQGHPETYPDLQVGARVEVVVFDADHPGRDDISLDAQVVRGDPSGFGLRFNNLTGFEAGALDNLLRRLGQAQA
jgi:hypothetical protein